MIHYKLNKTCVGTPPQILDRYLLKTQPMWNNTTGIYCMNKISIGLDLIQPPPHTVGAARIVDCLFSRHKSTILGIYFYILSHFCSRINNHIRYNTHNSTFFVSLELESRYSRLTIFVIYHMNQQLLASIFFSRKIQLLSMFKNC